MTAAGRTRGRPFPLRRGQAVVVALLAFAEVVSGCRSADRPVPETKPLRLIDVVADSAPRVLTIDGTTRRVLAQQQPQTIPLSPLHSVLRFSVGLEERPAPVPVRFRASLQRKDGSSQQVYERIVDTPGWHDDRLDLDSFDLDGAVLVLERNVVGEASERDLTRGVWGEPILLPRERAKRDSVVLVSIDTLRSDRVGAYGSPAGLTPALDELAKGGVLYEHAYSPSTWTLPSHFSMLRGVPVYWAPQRSGQPAENSHVETTALASVFRDAGYLTAGFTGGGYVSYHFGFAEGFDSYYSHPQRKRLHDGCDPERFDGPEVLRRTTEWLRANGDRPFFLFVHTYDAHDRCPLMQPRRRGAAKWDSSPKGRRRMSAYYDEMVAKADGILGELLAQIESLDSQPGVTIAVTSDHGEAIWEHGIFGHGCEAKPYDPLVRVPLVIRLAAGDRAGERIRTPVSVGSIAPTLLTLAGLSPPANMPLRPLPGLAIEGSQDGGPVYVACDGQIAVRERSYKLVALRGAPHEDEVYDLETDPAETHNLALEQPDVASELRALAGTYWHEASAKPEGLQGEKVQLDEVTRQRLRVLGYYE